MADDNEDQIDETLHKNLEAYQDVFDYIANHQHHVRAGDKASFPWPPVNKRLRYKCQDAYLLEDIARYKFKIKTPRKAKHQDLKERDGIDEYREWFNLPGRRDLYNERKELKAKADQDQQKIGLDAATNPFAPKEAKEKEKTLAEKRKAVSAQIKSKAPTGRFIEGTPLAESILDAYMERNATLHFILETGMLTIDPLPSESEGDQPQKKAKTLPTKAPLNDQTDDGPPYTPALPPPSSGRMFITSFLG
jgi:hypothetical protein